MIYVGIKLMITKKKNSNIQSRYKQRYNGEKVFKYYLKKVLLDIYAPVQKLLKTSSNTLLESSHSLLYLFATKLSWLK